MLFLLVKPRKYNWGRLPTISHIKAIVIFNWDNSLKRHVNPGIKE